MSKCLSLLSAQLVVGNQDESCLGRITAGFHDAEELGNEG